MVTPEQLAEARRALGRRLADLREAAGITQAQLARRTGYSRSAIANVESGRSTQPRSSWHRYEEVLNAQGALLAASDQYATMAKRYRQQAAQERARQRMANIEQWQPAHASDLTGTDTSRSRVQTPTTRGNLPAGYADGDEPPIGSTSATVGDTPKWTVPGAGVLSLVGSLPLDPNDLEPGRGYGMAAYEELSQRLWHLYWDVPAQWLFEAAYTQVRLGVELLGGVSVAQRRRAAGALTLSALLAARLAFFDLNRPGAATRCHQVALAAAKESEDHSMVAVVLGHMAFGPAFAREPGQAEELTALGLASAHRAGSLVRSWLHCVASEAQARAGNGSASLRLIDLAETALEADEPAPEWVDFYDISRLDCFAGYAATIAGQPTLAASRLSRAVAELGRNASKQLSVVCADLAVACRDDGDEAAYHLNEAINVLDMTWYEVGWDRVREARALLGDSRLGRQIDQRLAVLPVGRR